MSIIDDELSPRPVPVTYDELLARKQATEQLLGIKLPVSNYERRLHDSSATERIARIRSEVARTEGLEPEDFTGRPP
jgi:hypothetical protein